MEVSASIPMIAGLATTAVAGKGQAPGKATNGKDDSFGSLLLASGDANTQATDDDKKQADPLQAILAALNGGLTPMMVTLPQQLQPDAQNAGTGGAVSSITLNVGNQQLPFNLNNVQLNNGELAAMLQKFGASPALMSALLENPQGQVTASLASHPEILNDLENALSHVAQQALQTPAVLADPKLAGLMQSIVKESGQGQTATGDQNLDEKQPPALLAKLQASISTHAVETAPAQEKPSEQGTTAQQNNVSSNQLLGAQVQFPLQAQVQSGKADPNVVLMQADKFNTEFADLVVKRAALIESPGSQEFRILLQPQGMGEIEVRVQAVGNQISLQLSTDNATSKSILDAGLSNLKNQLQAQGIQFNRIEVTDSSLNNNTNQSNGSFSGLPQERGSGQSFQGQQGQQSSGKRDNRSFAMEALDAIEALGGASADPSGQGLEGIDVTA